jgi:predicted nucleic-acid-binding Zn-ribbon protein
MKNGLIIGTSKLYDVPDREFYLVSCSNCGTLFHYGKDVGEIKCLNRKEIIKLIKEKK